MTSAFENGLYGGLLLSIIAFSVVFIVLGGLTLLIVAIKFVGSSDRGSGKKGEVVYSGGEGASSEASAPVAQAVSTEWPTATEPQAIAKIEEEEIAAISAAIAAYGSAPFEIKSVRRVIPPRTGLWRKASFFESLEGIE